MQNSVFNHPSLIRAVRGAEGFPNPFLDLATLAMPDQHRTALDFCEYLWNSQETYREAQRRKVAYFLTDIDVRSTSHKETLGEDEKEKWRAFLNERMSMRSVLLDLLLNRECYGNFYASVMLAFKRMLVCPGKGCGVHFPLETVYHGPEFKFSWQLPDFHATCPRCGFHGAWRVNDLEQDLENSLSIKVWPPQEIEIVHDEYSGQDAYFWRIPEDYKRQIREGSLYHLERVPLPVLSAIRNNNLFRFHPGALFHGREQTIAGMRARGAGFSRLLLNFRQIMYVQVLRRANEAIGLDYVIPFRLLTPEASSHGQGHTSNPMKMLSGGDFAQSVMSMLRRRRRDPAGWHYLPYPVRYQALGGDANQFSPRDLLDQAYDILLNGGGTPAELYRGTLQLQTAPVSLRLFEATNADLVSDANRFLNWFAEQVAQIMSWEQVLVKMDRISHTDDFNKQMAMLQLMMGSAISQTTGLRPLGIDWDTEQRRIAEEARRQSELQSEMQEEMEQTAFGEQVARGQMGPPGAVPPGGAPPGAAGAGAAGGATPEGAANPMMNLPVTMLLQSSGLPQAFDDMMMTADALAQQLLMVPQSVRVSELRTLKNKSEALHALTKQKMDTARSKQRTVGAAMLGPEGQAAA